MNIILSLVLAIVALSMFNTYEFSHRMYVRDDTTLYRNNSTDQTAREQPCAFGASGPGFAITYEDEDCVSLQQTMVLRNAGSDETSRRIMRDILREKQIDDAVDQ